MKGFNLRTQQLRLAIIKDLNDSMLPISTKTMVLNEILQTMKPIEANTILFEKQEYEKKLAEKQVE